MTELSNIDHRTAALALLSHALRVVKSMPLKIYDPASVVKAMQSIETALYEVEHSAHEPRT